MIALKKISLLLLPLLILSLSPSLFGQAVSGTLLGTINDPTGAAVAAARVIVIETATQTAHETVTNDSGNYTLPNLPPGTYSITVEANGFKKDTHEGIDLLTNTSTRVDFALVTGSASETITVSTAPALLQTDRADISTTLEAHQITNLPLSSGNSFQSLLNTVPGMAPVVFNNSQFFNANNDLSVNANGQSSYVNLYQIEGIDDDQRTGIHIILVPQPPQSRTSTSPPITSRQSLAAPSAASSTSPSSQVRINFMDLHFKTWRTTASMRATTSPAAPTDASSTTTQAVRSVAQSSKTNFSSSATSSAPPIMRLPPSTRISPSTTSLTATSTSANTLVRSTIRRLEIQQIATVVQRRPTAARAAPRSQAIRSR
ncbi:carboxypeptidase-like regulatory domain-containing protein [Tunturiibacter empetritectus]|uniref:carboxypeptidase-like regulatory domain-containing protein n=1 Tax=Tunturiibacter empetritectus TaxID=3069691 RepID=UPI003D9BB160